uniref:Rhodanese domain-containing protein n=1 Tax=Guillardia theta TaxID=55529 RepID=A0A7S4NPN9_GUITH|mmetsp:Transcript_2886/g.9720  ORF Transcript_2886/g.9720 Transcript_2886/m.9720 type:complete len:585 (+) Transcript_2886:162-1916(+)
MPAILTRPIMSNAVRTLSRVQIRFFSSTSGLLSKKIVIVGGVAGGASAAARLRRLDENATITVFEKGPFVSFANCGLPYYVGDVIKDDKDLVLATPALFKNRYKIDVRTQNEVVKIDTKAKTVEVKDVAKNTTSTESYDALVLAPGAFPIRPPLPGIDLPGIFLLRTIPDSMQIRAWMDQYKIKRAVVVGGGFIGLETAENLVHRGIEVTIVEMGTQILPPMDPEMAEILHEHCKAKGVNLCLGDGVAGFYKTDTGLEVATQSGARYPCEVAILGIGVRPETKLAKEAGLELGKLGGIKVDEQMRTSDPNIWAVGDAVEVKDFVTGQMALVPLAGPANRQGRIAADAINGRSSTFRGVQGTAVCGVFDKVAASTGASEKTLKRYGIPYEKVYLHPNNHVGYYPGAKMIHFKLLYSPKDGKILGAQAIGEAGVEKRIDVVAMAIQQGMTVYDLEESELCYAPQFGAAKDPVNFAGFIASNSLRGDSPIVHWDAIIKGECDPNHVLVDVRTKEEINLGMYKGAKHIPIDEMRARMSELPKDKPIYLYCGVGLRGYNVVRMLKQNGYQAYNVPGGWKTYAYVSKCVK